MLYFIVNALAGKGKGKETAQRIKDLLNEKKVQFVMAFTEAREHAVSLARKFSKKEDCRGIVAVGGDGTFSEVLNGIDLNVPLGFVSAGTGNDFMRTFAPQTSVEEQLQPIIENKTKKIDFIKVNEKRCLNVSGTGFDVDILLRQAKFRKVLGGSVSYYAALFVTLFSLIFRNIKLKIDDERNVEESFVIASLCNGSYFGGGMPVSLSSRLDDGVMELQLVKKLPWYRMPKVLMLFLKGRVTEMKKYVDVYPCTKVEGSISPFVKFQLDGELYDFDKFTAQLNPGALTVFAS